MHALVLAALASSPGPAHGAHEDPAARAVPTEPEPVAVTLAGPASVREPLHELLAELLAPLSVAPRWRARDAPDLLEAISPRSPDPTLLASVMVDLSHDDHALIFVADRGFTRILVRRVPLADGVDEVAREQIGAIASGAIQALLAGAQIGMTRDEAARAVRASTSTPTTAPEPAPTPTPKPAPASTPTPEPPPEPSSTAPFASEPTPTATAPRPIPWTAATAGYHVSFWRGGEAIGHGPQLGLELGAGRPGWTAGLALSGAALLPQTVGEPVLATRLTGASLRLAALVRGWVHPKVALRGQLGLGLDLLRAAPEGGARRWTPLPMAEATFATDLFVTARLWIGVGLALSSDLVDTRIVDGAGVVVLDPWRVRPGLRLGLGWRFAGATARRR